MHIPKGLTALSLLVLAACSSMTSSKPSVNDDPAFSSTKDLGVTIRQLNEPLLTVNGFRTADVAFDVEVVNTTDQPLTLKRVTLQSVSAQPYQIGLTTRPYNKVIPPHSTESVQFWASASVNDFSMGHRVPVVLQANLITRDAAGKDQKSRFTRQVTAEYRLGVVR